MYTCLLLLLMSLLASVFSLSGDRKLLLDMMLGLPGDDTRVPPTYNPTWTPMAEGRSSKWHNMEDSSDMGIFGQPYSSQDLSSEFQSEPNVQKKWANHGGFICCNLPPTPHPRTKRFKSTSDKSLRSILLKGIARSMARNRLNEEIEDETSDVFGNINYADVDPRFLSLPSVEDNNMNAHPESQLYPNILRKRVRVCSKKCLQQALPSYRSGALSSNRYGQKRSYENDENDELQQFYIPVLYVHAFWGLVNVTQDITEERSRRSNNTYLDPFTSIGGMA